MFDTRSTNSTISLDILPQEILHDILIHCDIETVNAVSLVSKQLYTVTRDNLLWHHFCKPDLDSIQFHPSSLTIPVDGYRAEYLYQRSIDRVVEENLKLIVQYPESRFEKILFLSRIGLRCRVKLQQIVFHNDYDRYNLRYRYFASELIQVISYRESAMKALDMFRSEEPFDLLELYFAFDAFKYGKSIKLGPSCEETYSDELNRIKKALTPIKTKFIRDSNQVRSIYSKTNFIESTAKSLGEGLQNMNLIIDAEESSFRTPNSEYLPQYYISGVLSKCLSSEPLKYNTPSHMLLRASLYVYFAKWIGLEASIIVLKFGVFVRIEDPSRAESHTFNLDKAKGCFFADMRRAGKIREVDEIMDVIKITKLDIKDLSPSSSTIVMDSFSQECIKHLRTRTNKFENQSVCLLFLGAVLCSFLLAATQRQQTLNTKFPILIQDSSTRLDLSAQSLDQLSPSSIYQISNKPSTLEHVTAPMIPQSTNNTGYDEDHLNRGFSLVLAVITFQIPSAFVLVTDFLLTLVPKNFNKEPNVLQIIIDKLMLKEQTTESVSLSSVLPDPKFKPGDPIFHIRTREYGVVISSWRDGDVQYLIYVEGCRLLTVREYSIDRALQHPNMQNLLQLNSMFFGVDIGLYCSSFVENESTSGYFELAPELTCSS